VHAFLAALTPATSFARFFSGLGNPPEAMVRALVEPAPGRGAWLATLHSTPGVPGSHAGVVSAQGGQQAQSGQGGQGGQSAVVGHASWVRTGGDGEISVVVADAWQGLGLGSALVGAVLAELRRTAAGGLRIDVLASNRLVNAMIGRRWPGARPERDGTQLTYRVALS
jgi:GNAT superfamily N-acetyltransferase